MISLMTATYIRLVLETQFDRIIHSNHVEFRGINKWYSLKWKVKSDLVQ